MFVLAYVLAPVLLLVAPYVCILPPIMQCHPYYHRTAVVATAAAHVDVCHYCFL